MEMKPYPIFSENRVALFLDRWNENVRHSSTCFSSSPWLDCNIKRTKKPDIRNQEDWMDLDIAYNGFALAVHLYRHNNDDAVSM